MSLLAILTASLLGSLHCAAMCGGFAIFSVGEASRPWVGTIYYNLGRLITYLALGVLAGAIGQALDLAGSGIGISRFASYILGTMMIVWGVAQLLKAKFRFFDPIHTLTFKAHSSIISKLDKFSGIRPLIVGMLSTLLPCGWLYGFAMVAAATGDIYEGVLVMLVFWVGTLPMMAAVGRLAQRILGRWGRELPAITASLIILAGIFAILGHVVVTHHHHHH